MGVVFNKHWWGPLMEDIEEAMPLRVGELCQVAFEYAWPGREDSQSQYHRVLIHALHIFKNLYVEQSTAE